jgi:hypothetical protein
MKFFISLFLLNLVLTPSFGADDCPGAETFTVVEELASQVFKVTEEMSQTQKVLGVTITKFFQNQGTGKVSVITDAKGNLAGIRVDFNLKGKKSQTMVKTFDELNNGQKLEYIEGNEKNPALVVKKGSGASIYPSTGGEFTFSVLTKKPNAYQHHNIFLRKVEGKWIVKNSNGKVLKSVDLTPNVEDLNWNGTFSGANFE